MLVKFAIKAAIASGAVYWTNQLEIWGRLSAEPVAYDRLLDDTKGYLKQITPKSLEVSNVVNSSDICSVTNHYYNTAVTSTFGYLVALPSNVCKLYDSAVEKLKAQA